MSDNEIPTLVTIRKYREVLRQSMIDDYDQRVHRIQTRHVDELRDAQEDFHDKLLKFDENTATFAESGILDLPMNEHPDTTEQGDSDAPPLRNG